MVRTRSGSSPHPARSGPSEARHPVTSTLRRPVLPVSHWRSIRMAGLDTSGAWRGRPVRPRRGRGLPPLAWPLSRITGPGAPPNSIALRPSRMVSRLFRTAAATCSARRPGRRRAVAGRAHRVPGGDAAGGVKAGGERARRRCSLRRPRPAGAPCRSRARPPRPASAVPPRSASRRRADPCRPWRRVGAGLPGGPLPDGVIRRLGRTNTPPPAPASAARRTGQRRRCRRAGPRR